MTNFCSLMTLMTNFSIWWPTKLFTINRPKNIKIGQGPAPFFWEVVPYILYLIHCTVKPEFCTFERCPVQGVTNIWIYSNIFWYEYSFLSYSYNFLIRIYLDIHSYCLYCFSDTKYLDIHSYCVSDTKYSDIRFFLFLIRIYSRQKIKPVHQKVQKLNGSNCSHTD